MERCTKAVIYKDNLEYNLKQIRKYVKKDVKLCVAVKADGYGHGAFETARAAIRGGADMLAVASTGEGKLSRIASMDPSEVMAMDGIGKGRYSSIAASFVTGWGEKRLGRNRFGFAR